MENKKYIALDLGNCCINVNTEECLRRIGLKSIEDVPKEFMDSCARFECGLISNEQWLCDFRNATGGILSDQELIEAWNSIVGDEIEGMADAVGEIISRGYKVAILSDTSELHLKFTFNKLSFTKMLSGGIYSFDVGVRKPSEKMYSSFEKKFGIPLLYTDDRIENIQAAESLGWNAHLFKTASAFLKAFKVALSEKNEVS